MSRIATRIAAPILMCLTGACASPRVPAGGARAEGPASTGACAAPGVAAGGARAEEPASEVLARGEGFTITVDDFRARFAEQSEAVRARYSTPNKGREFLDNLVRFEVLAAEARRQGLDRHPEVVLVTKKIMVQRLVKNRFAYEGDKAEKTKAFDAYLESLLKQANVQVSGAALESLYPRRDYVTVPEPPPTGE